MTNTSDNKYYVFGTSWEGISLKESYDLERAGYVTVCDTYEEAMNEIDRLWEEELAPDEGAYIRYQGKFIYQD